MEKNPRTWLASLRRSHDLLARVVPTLTPRQVEGPSYCSEWTVAQVLSHLGSGAEIFCGLLGGVLPGGEPFDRSDFAGVWARWDAKSPAQQASDVVAADTHLVIALEGLGDDLESVHPRAMGREMTMAEYLAMRLGEHALHVWDVAVVLDPSARVEPSAVTLLVDRLPQVAGSLGRAPGEGAPPLRVVVATTEPDRTFTIEAGTGVTITDAGRPTGRPDLTLPAEAFLRLAYGRLDPDHTPPGITAPGGDPGARLERLRDVFPGN